MKEIDIQFPNPELADKDGLLAIGGNLEPATLIKAYSMGIFPWYSDDSPILWWSPDPRLVLFPEKYKVSDSLRQKINKKMFKVKIDTDFKQVIESCSEIPRKEQQGTWITKEMKAAYIALHKKGFAHSFETYYGNKLVGGLYGVSLGAAFFGESMFHIMTDASKVALYHLIEIMKKYKFQFVDAQQSTQHLRSMGAEEIKRKDFLLILHKALDNSTKKGKWKIE